MRLQILTLNLANPSAARAERQLAWLAERPEQVLVLTETGPGPGTQFLIDRLRSAGWEVRTASTTDGERGVAIAARISTAPAGGDVVEFLPARAQLAALAGLDVLGLYVPSRDESTSKAERKRRFCAGIEQRLPRLPTRHMVLIGDLNILERGHQPHHGVFRDWEYEFYDALLAHGFVDAYRAHQPDRIEHSWVDYDGRGYRFDHAFVSAALAPAIVRCDYLHATREQELSDHSALTLELELLEELETTALTADSLALF